MSADDPNDRDAEDLDRDRLLREAPTAEEAMRAAKTWIDGLRKIGRPVFLAAPAVWDGIRSPPRLFL